MISKEDINKIREDTDLIELIREHDTDLTPAGTTGYKGLCPLPAHDEKTPSFTVNPDTNRYICFGCGESGDVFDYLREVQGMSFIESLQSLAQRLNMPLKHVDGKAPTQGNETSLADVNEAAREFYTQQMNSKVTEFIEERGMEEQYLRDEWGVGYSHPGNLFAFLQERGFTMKNILDAGLARRSEKNGNTYEFFRGRMMWTIYDHLNRVAGFGARRIYDNDPLDGKFINTPATDLYKKHSVLFGLNKARTGIRKDKVAVLCEGYTDVVSYFLADLPYAIAPCGTSFTADQMKRIGRMLGPGGELVVSMDGDTAGIKSMQKILAIASEYQITLSCVLFPNQQDPDAYRIEHGVEGLREIFNNRAPLIETLIEHAIKGYDLQEPDQSFQAANVAADILADVKQPALAERYQEWVSQRLKVTGESVRALVPERQAPRKQKIAMPRGFEYDLLRIAYQLPQAFNAHRDELLDMTEHISIGEIRDAIEEMLWLDPEEEDSVWRETLIGTLSADLIQKAKRGIPPNVLTNESIANEYAKQVIERVQEDARNQEEEENFANSVLAKQDASGIFDALIQMTGDKTTV